LTSDELVARIEERLESGEQGAESHGFGQLRMAVGGQGHGVVVGWWFDF
jgi:hypothetical protein